MNYVVVCISPKGNAVRPEEVFAPRDAPRRAAIATARIPLDTKDRITELFSEVSSAEAEAKALAGLNPKRQYAVMGIMKVFETAEPSIITKVINSDNELVLEQKA